MRARDAVAVLGQRGSAGPIRLALLGGPIVPYKVPLYRRLAEDPRLEFTAIFFSAGGVKKPFDNGYGEPVTWDVDVTGGYRSKFLRKAGTNPVLGRHTWSIRDWDVVAEIVRGGYEVLALEGYNALTYVMAAAAQRAVGGHLLFREEQTLLEPRGLLATLVKEPALTLLFRQGRAMFISRENRRWFEHYRVPAKRLFSTPYAVDNAELQMTAARLAPSRAALRASFGIADDVGPVILTVGRLIPKKQPLFLLDAFAQTRKRVRCALLVVGSGELEASMQAMVRERSIPDVFFAGFVNQRRIGEAYAAADVFALLSATNETFGVVVPEAMNFRLPIVVSERVGCAADLVSHNWNGFTVSSTDPIPAAQAFERLVTDESLRAAMGRASLERVDAWRLDDAVEGICAAVADAVGEHRWAETGSRGS